MRSDQPEGLKILLVGLYSSRYPAAGESHGLSVIAGAVKAHFDRELSAFEVLDLVTIGSEDSRIIRSKVEDMQPDILAISVPYGTYDCLLELKGDITNHLNKGGLALVGGALPTYLGSRILNDIDKRVIVVRGEGDRSAPEVIRFWQAGDRLHTVPNLVFSDNGAVVETARMLTGSNDVAVPYREHLGEAIAQGIQVYTEASRGCSWAACTFCLRGLTDVKGTAREYRRLPFDRLRKDLRNLKSLGATQVTFADEDFIGGDPKSLNKLLELLTAINTEKTQSSLYFDVSATTRSIFDESDTPLDAAQKVARLRALQQIGLNKVFLGVESGSPTQLKRYAKGHTPHEIVAACQIVLGLGLNLELGFIMFDPLCTIEEIIENVDFLLDNSLAGHVSGPTSELRLQVDSRYINVLRRTERQTGQSLYKRDVDPNTLSHRYNYANTDVERLVTAVTTWDRVVHPFVYATKGLTRHGRGILPSAEHDDLKALLGDYRESTLRALRVAAGAAEPGLYQAGTISPLTKLMEAASTICTAGDSPSHPMITKMVAQAQMLTETLAVNRDH